MQLKTRIYCSLRVEETLLSPFSEVRLKRATCSTRQRGWSLIKGRGDESQTIEKASRERPTPEFVLSLQRDENVRWQGLARRLRRVAQAHA